MPSADPHESARMGWLGHGRAARGVRFACAVAVLSAVVVHPVRPESAGPPIHAGASEIRSVAARLEPRSWAPRTVHEPIRSLSTRGRIRIPAIGVDATLIPRGLSADRSLEVPRDWGVAGWFEGGPFPGESGPAVVVGHVDSTSGPAVFYRLRELHRGDVIVVWREGGSRSRFLVDSLRWFSKSAFPTELVYGVTAGPALRLITCGGAFDRSTGHYVDNLVVFASPMTDP